MFAIVGVIIVFASVIGGYIMHHGQLLVLYQPSEYLIIGGAAIGILLVANPLAVIKRLISQLIGMLGSGPSRQDFNELLVMMYEFFVLSKQSGLMGLESHFENPDSSAILKRYPKFMKNHHALSFMSDTMKVIIMGGVPAYDLEDLMDKDLEVHHKEASQPAAALARIADALPGLGIVAAVLGVVITMGSIGGPAAEIGMKVAAALVGTFLGILLAYGVVAPIGVNIENRNEADFEYFRVMKQGMLGFYKGFPPVIAVEFARRSIPGDLRPGFQETEDACREAKKKN
ncbi:MAG: flagellar motor stator protein MotA [candidate division Zixibacteria bacterium]|nr:flagellar motor stator protein MotA [candidate division Zixibacteria bacterium]